MTVFAASAREEIADFLSALLTVYIIVIVAWIVISFAFAIPDAPVDADLLGSVHERFARLGTVVDVPESLMRIAGATGGVGPAYWALLVEAQVDAAVRRGMPPALASAIVTETMAGSAELLRAREHDTLALRRAVASPGGTTARGLAALERGGVRAALLQAMDDVVGA